VNVDLWTQLLPWLVLLARISAFFVVLPIFGWQWLPVVVRSGIAMLVTLSYGLAGHLPSLAPADLGLLASGVLVAREALCGLGLGLAASLIYLSVQQMGQIISQQMGLAEAGIIDPVTGEQSDVMEMFFQITFVVLFLAAGGHHLLLRALWGSYAVFPAGQGPEMSALAEVVVQAGSDMLLFSLQMAGPLLAAFLVLTVALGALSKAMPEVNILYMSFPFRIGLGVLMASTMVPMLRGFTDQMAQWMGRYLTI
jgi:flagellar biosynthesis protein FliR